VRGMVDAALKEAKRLPPPPPLPTNYASLLEELERWISDLEGVASDLDGAQKVGGCGGARQSWAGLLCVRESGRWDMSCVCGEVDGGPWCRVSGRCRMGRSGRGHSSVRLPPLQHALLCVGMRATAAEPLSAACLRAGDACRSGGQRLGEGGAGGRPLRRGLPPPRLPQVLRRVPGRPTGRLLCISDCLHVDGRSSANGFRCTA
jgi:hypothetical protein